jgi:ribonuclease BN (tRNA processing enzyme)
MKPAQDLETLIAAEVIVPKKGTKPISEEILVWDLNGKEIILSSSNLSRARHALKSAERNVSTVSIADKNFTVDKYVLYEIQKIKPAGETRLNPIVDFRFLEGENKDNYITFLGTSGQNVIVGNSRGKVYALNAASYSNIADLKLLYGNDRVAPVDHANLFNLNGLKLLVQHGDNNELILCDAKSADCDSLTDPAKFYFSHIDEINIRVPGVISRTALFKVRKSLSFTPLGIGNAFSTQHDNTCFILDADKPYLIDCSEDLRKLGALEEKINDIILTHNDPDHVGALRKLIQKKCFKYKSKINIHTTKKIYDDFMQSLYGLQDALKNSIEFIELKHGTTYQSDSGLKIDVRDNIHGDVTTIGFKIFYKDKIFGYSSDCKYDLNVIQKNFDKERSNYLKNYIKHKKIIETLCSMLSGVRQSDEWIEFANDAICETSSVSRIAEQVPGLSEKIVTLVNEMHKHKDWHKIMKNFKSKELKLLKYTLDRDYSLADLKKLTRDALWFYDCDIIVHEATDNKNDPVHTYVGELEKLPKEIKKKMFLTHVPDGFEFDYTGSIPILKEGTRYRL